MPLHWVLTVLLSGAVVAVHGQKIVQKRVLNPKIKSIYVDAYQCYFIELKTSSAQELQVAAFFEGEYQNELAVTLREEGNSLLIGTEFQPNFLLPSDKLSAHKVISVAMAITLPENMAVAVFGSSAKVEASGVYRQLAATLSDGDCTLNAVAERIIAKTQTGTITVTASTGEVQAQSTYGHVRAQQIPTGDSLYKLTSVTGNIVVKRTE